MTSEKRDHYIWEFDILLSDIDTNTEQSVLKDHYVFILLKLTANRISDTKNDDCAILPNKNILIICYKS